MILSRSTVLVISVAASLVLGASAAENSLRADLVRQTHDVDSANDRLIRGGLGLATALAGGDAVREPSAKALSWRALSSGAEGILYREPSGLVLAFDVSSQGAVAVLVAASESWPTSQTKLFLHIVDAKGKVTGNELADATGELAWSSDGTYLAYCTGRADVSRDDIASSGTWVLNVVTGDVRKVSDRGRHVAWNKSDGAFYIYSVPGPGETKEQVLRYDPPSGAVSETQRKGIYFSPSGSYYYRGKSQNFGSFDLFDSTSDASVLSKSKILSELVPQPVGWLPDEDLLLFETWYYGDNARRPEKAPHSMLFDPRSDTVVDLGDAAVLGYDRLQRAVRWRAGSLDQLSTRDLVRGGTTVPARAR